ncbi:alpha/beta hydrolase [Pseudonocardia sp. N23]|uniref:alpha/beta hydrolase n=1 Tax=Pseudonocardia sp. N23 TaxID=1987376 RepID=UPI000BFB79A0|nr:alpha/beta hydrolase [Pseudonocardia sp. N23]GAY11869.1 esterase [Pseudonocardia sp. N23]
MTLDAASQALIDQIAARAAPRLYELPLDQARAAAGVSMARTERSVAEVSDVTIDGPDGGFGIRVLRPHGRSRAVIVHYHGGGWALSSAAAFTAFGTEVAARTNCLVALVDYRLAPEHAFPVPVEDAWSALRWAAEHLTVDSGQRLPLLVSGDSAGGNLAAVVAQRATRHGAPPLAGQLLCYPVTDCDLDRDGYLDPANQLLLDRASMEWFWSMYLPDVALRRDSEASPGRAPDLSGLPPTVVITAEHDVLAEEGEAYADRLRDAGVRVTHRRFEGQMHSFLSMVGVLPGSAAGFDFIEREVDAMLRNAL